MPSKNVLRFKEVLGEQVTSCAGTGNAEAMEMMRWIGLWMLLLMVPTQAQGVKGFSGPAEPVSDSDVASHFKRYSKSESFLERWRIAVFRQDGGWLEISFVLTNLGPGDGHSAVDVKRFAHDIAAPKTEKSFYRWPKKFEPGSFKANGKSLNLKIGDCSLKKSKGGWKGRIKAWGYELEFSLKKTGPAWKPGNGTASYPDGKFHLSLPATRARFSGRERSHGGAWGKVTGIAWFEHVATNVPPHHLAERWLGFSAKKGRYSINYLEVFVPKLFGGERYGWMVITHGKKLVASSLAARSTKVKRKREKLSPFHKVPTRYVVNAKTPKGPIQLEVRVGSGILRDEVLAKVPTLIRVVVQVFIQPYNFYKHSRFKLTLPDGTVVNGSRGVTTYSPMRAR